jgi:serine/threonine protein kinase, bacterial
VEGAIAKLSTQRNVHLWVAYVNNFSGLTAFRWAQDTMRANGFSDTEGLLAIATANRTFAFRPPAAMTNGTNGTRVNAELIRKDRIAPAVRNDEWARAAVGAAEGLQTAG